MRMCVALGALLFSFFAVVATTASAQTAADADWVLLGELRLARHLKQDSIDLADSPTPVSAIRLVAKGGRVTLSRVQVYWAGGDLHSESRVISLLDGERTRPISPASDGARMSRLGIVYEIPDNQAAEIQLQVWGLKASSPDAPLPAADAAKRGLYVHKRTATRSLSPSLPKAEPSREASLPNDNTPRSVETPPPVSAAADDCITHTSCTPVPVFFGTNRQRKDEAGTIRFAQDRTNDLTLGQATVTVPRAFRNKGEITRPSWWDLLKLKNPWSQDSSRHFTILNGATKVYASPAEFLAAVTAARAEGKVFRDHAFVFVHGYNVSFEYALYRTAQIAFDLGEDDQPFGTAFLYSWPSAGETESYVYDLESAEKAVPTLQAFLDLVVNRTGASHVHLIAHSMGNGPLLAALDNVAKSGQGRAVVEQVILAAPDVDAKDFAELSARILPVARTLTLYASSEDRAMLASRKLRRDNARAGDVINGIPVIVSGLDTIDVTSVGTSMFSYNHNTYADRKELLNDIRRLMLTNERPPNLRDLTIRRITDQKGTFWRFVK